MKRFDFTLATPATAGFILNNDPHYRQTYVETWSSTVIYANLTGTSEHYMLMRFGPPLSFISPVLLPMRSSAKIRRNPPRRQQDPVAVSSISPPPSPNPVWRKITVPDRYLRLSQTLHMGQAFRWHPTPTPQPVPQSASDSSTPDPNLTREWAGCIDETLYILRQADPEPPDDEPDPVYYLALPAGDESVAEHHHAVLIDFFRANADYTDLFAELRKKDAVFDRVFPYFRGVRTIRHDPVECLFSYVCSSNNHMKRTAAMVNHLGDTYGTYVASYEERDYNAFPSVQALAEKATVTDLRAAGFGYRANYVVSTANALVEVAQRDGQTPKEMLLSWRKLPRKEVEKKLIQFPGIGRKVAGCIAMMSLDQLGEIPVDTHVWQMGERYLPELKGKKLSKKTYDAIGECFREKFGEETAGLAHNILFAAELDEFKDVIPGGVPAKLWAKSSMKIRRKPNVKQEEEDSAYADLIVPRNADNSKSSTAAGRKRRRESGQ